MRMILQLLAACQGAFILGIITILLYVLFNRGIKQKKFKWYIIFSIISYICIIACTMISIYHGFYDNALLWQTLVIAGYGFGDIAIITLFRNIIREK